MKRRPLRRHGAGAGCPRRSGLAREAGQRPAGPAARFGRCRPALGSAARPTLLGRAAQAAPTGVVHGRLHGQPAPAPAAPRRPGPPHGPPPRRPGPAARFGRCRPALGSAARPTLLGRAAKAAPTVVVLGLLLALAAPASEAQVSLEQLEARLAAGPALADLTAYGTQASPMVRSARYEWRAAVERRRVATGLPDPELMLEQSNPVEEMWMGRLTQMVPFPGKLGRAGSVAEADARVARIETDRTGRDVALQVREAFHELSYVRQARTVIDGNLGLLEHLRKAAETGFVRDRATLVDVTKAQSQLAQLQYDALLMEELQETLTARLNAVLGRAPEAPLGPLAAEPLLPLTYSLEEIHALAREGRDEVRIAEAQIHRAEAAQSLMGYERLPDFTVGLLRDPLDKGGRDSVGFIVGMTLPLWPGKNAGRVAEARAMAESARAMRDAQVYETGARVREAYFRVRNAERLVRLYRDELIPQAANSLEVAETWYRQGQGSFSDFVETQAASYNFQLALARARADHGKALARLERLAGRGLTAREEPAGDEPGKEPGR